MDSLEGLKDLGGKTAVVTGGGSGIGRAIVEQLTAQGASVLAADRNNEALADVAASCGCSTMEIDVTSESANQELMATAVAEFGSLDMVFLNAGILGRRRESLADPYVAGDLDLDRYRAVMAVNADAVVIGTVAATKVMAEQNGGAIVATASTAGLSAWSATPFYAASKHAVVGWVRAMARALERDGVTINAICPAGVATPLVGRNADDAGDESRLLRPETVAKAAIDTALGGATGQAVSVVAGRDPVWEPHEFNDVRSFPSD